jgi:hypothetical protein
MRCAKDTVKKRAGWNQASPVCLIGYLGQRIIWHITISFGRGDWHSVPLIPTGLYTWRVPLPSASRQVSGTERPAQEDQPRPSQEYEVSSFCSGARGAAKHVPALLPANHHTSPKGLSRYLSHTAYSTTVHARRHFRSRKSCHRTAAVPPASSSLDERWTLGGMLPCILHARWKCLKNLAKAGSLELPPDESLRPAGFVPAAGCWQARLGTRFLAAKVCRYVFFSAWCFSQSRTPDGPLRLLVRLRRYHYCWSGAIKYGVFWTQPNATPRGLPLVCQNASIRP